MSALSGGAVGGDPVPDHVFRALLADGEGLPTSDGDVTATLNTTSGTAEPVWDETGPFGEAPRFDHSGAANTAAYQFDVPDMTGFSAWTVAKWMKADTATLSRWPSTVTNQSSTALRIVGAYPYDNTGGVWVAQYSGGWDSENHSAATPSFRGSWHHFACSYSEASQAFTLYYDGADVTEASPSGVSRASGDISASTFNRILIPGRWDGGEGIVGSVQDYRLYDRVLTAQEVSDIYDLGA